jgi:hypothetical protein
VPDQIQLVLFVLTWMAVYTALGIGPAWVLGRGMGSRLVLAPILGMAIGSSVFTTSYLVMSGRTAAFVLLVPMMVASLSWFAVAAARERPALDVRESAIPWAVAAGSALLAMSPALSRGSVGPFSWVLRDTYWYTQTAYRLRDHSYRDALTASELAHDLIGTSAAVTIQNGGRLGITAFYSTITALIDVPGDKTIFATVVVMFALMPLSVWWVARQLGGTRLAATVACVIAPLVTVSLVVDSALGNLLTLIVVPPLILVVARMVSERSWPAVVIAGLLAGALVSSYPELVPFTVASLVLAAIIGFVYALRERRDELRSLLLGGLGRVAAAVGIMIAIAPWTSYKLIDYLLVVRQSAPSFVDRGLTPETTLSWLFGVRSIYEVEFNREIPLGAGGAVLAVLLPILLAVGALLGIFAARVWLRSAVLLVPIVVSLALGYYAFKTGAVGGDCQYCLWKGLTFQLPALAVAIGLGVDALWRLAARTDRVRYVAAAGIASVALGLAAVGYQAVRQSQDVDAEGVFVPRQLRDTVDAVLAEVPPGSGVFLEGLEDTGDAVAYIPAVYHVAKYIPDAKPFFDVDYNRGEGFHILAQPSFFLQLPPPESYADPDYRYVLTAFSGLDSNRRRLAEEGRWAFEERAPIDVIVTRTNKIIGGADPEAAVPVQPPADTTFELWVSTPPARAGAGHVIAATSTEVTTQPTFSAGGRALRTIWGDGGGRFCIDVDLAPGFTEIVSKPPVSPTVGMRLTEVAAGRGPCAPLVTGWTPAVEFTNGVYDLEPMQFGGRGARWLRTTARLRVGTPGYARPATTVRLPLASFVDSRTVTARLDDGTVLDRVRVAATLEPNTTLVMRIPAGRGAERVTISSDPGGFSATRVDPNDPRVVAVLAGQPEVSVTR